MDKSKKLSIPAIVSLVLCIVFFTVFLVRNVIALKYYAADFHDAEAVSSFAETRVYLRYPGFFSIGFGMEGSAVESVAFKEYQDFMQGKTAIINEAVYCDIAFYMLMSLCAGSLFLKEHFPKKWMFADSAVYLFYTLAIRITYAVLKLPVNMMGFRSFVYIGISFLSMLAFLSLTEMLLTVGKRKIIMAALSVILLSVFYFTGFFAKFCLLSPEEIPSFDYLYEADERYGDEAYDDLIYYDSVKGVMVIDGEEYAPELVKNPNSVQGIERVLYQLIEGVNPSAGVYLGTIVRSIENETESTVSLSEAFPYALQAAAWLTVNILIIKKKEE